MSLCNQFKIESKLSEVKVMAAYFRDFCDQNQLDEKEYNLLELALIEALNNIIIHAYDNKSGSEIIAQYEYSNSEIIITLTDFGKALPKQTLEREAVKTLTLDEQIPEANWGIDLITSITDVVIRYRFKQTNTLILKKKVQR